MIRTILLTFGALAPAVSLFAHDEIEAIQVATEETIVPVTTEATAYDFPSTLTAEQSTPLPPVTQSPDEEEESMSKLAKKLSRLHIGGYGEVALSRNFYSDNVYRYKNPSDYTDDPSHGRFDIPHAVIYLSYDFGKGWLLSTEIEFEHGGSGSAVEKEWDEGGEWETETEKGGEVELEQFWIQKTIFKELNIRVGHIVVPVGLTNAYHEPLNFFTVYRPEGENTILPCTWHDTGISIWGRSGDFRYEVQLIAGLDAYNFDRDGWIADGANSAFEFKVANKYGFVARVDNYTVPGLRIGLSGYYGKSMHNTYPHDSEGETSVSKNVKGRVAIGSIDFSYQGHNWIVRGSADYGYLSDAKKISELKNSASAGTSNPYSGSIVGKNAVAIGAEAGWDLFSQISKLRNLKQKLYLFGRYDYYNSYIPASDQYSYNYTRRNCMTFGINYMPLPQIVVKADYSKRFLRSGYNNEPSINLGIAYQGFFL